MSVEQICPWGCIFQSLLFNFLKQDDSVLDKSPVGKIPQRPASRNPPLTSQLAKMVHIKVLPWEFLGSPVVRNLPS